MRPSSTNGARRGASATSEAERIRLRESREALANWKRWGPYVSDREWGTVREDYSADGDAWNYFPFEHARSRAYRWGEDGLGAICDRWQHLCFGLALWNGRDPFLKERLFGLTNQQGNHGEDVKEQWWAIESTPTHSYMRWLYKYPQAAFPYEQLIAENARRTRHDREYELVDTGVFDGDRYFDVELVYAKAAPDDLCIEIVCRNRGPEGATLHVLPTVWFRNTWAWGSDPRKPQLWSFSNNAIEMEHSTLGRFWLACAGKPRLLFCENETNRLRLFGAPNETRFPKDGINDHVVSGTSTVNEDERGTKAAAWYVLHIGAGDSSTLSLRLANAPPQTATFAASFSSTLQQRAAEADAFYEGVTRGVSATEKQVYRRAMAGMLWTKQYYHFNVERWLEGDPGSPPPPDARREGRNRAWTHLANTDIISMPDSWEYPWYAAWDLAFHVFPLALVDPDFAKEQLVLFCREWFMHPNGQLPAYEWDFGDANPPVHAWAAWRVFKIDAKYTGRPDYAFLERIFHKLLLNFTWWVNRKDAEGRNVFEGGFLGLDNIGLFDRSRPLSGSIRLEQSDATSWMAMFCLNMLAIAIELARHNRAYEDVATKFFEHFLYIADAINNLGGNRTPLWDDADGFYYDLLDTGDAQMRLRVRSIVGLIPLCAVATIDLEVLDALPDFAARMRWFMRKRADLCKNVFQMDAPGAGERRLLSIVDPGNLRRLLKRMLDENEFLSPFGIRSMSRIHERQPVELALGDQLHRMEYEPGESRTGMFGGNSNWRGPIWMPINYLLIESLQKFHHYLGDEFMVEFPTRSGNRMNLRDVASELSRRLISLFTHDERGRRPLNGGVELFDQDPHWRDHVTFNEYFDAESGAGLGASHQTGWTGLVAKLIRQTSPEPEPSPDSARSLDETTATLSA